MAFVLKIICNAQNKVKPSTLVLVADEMSSARVVLLKKKAQTFAFVNEKDDFWAGKS